MIANSTSKDSQDVAAIASEDAESESPCESTVLSEEDCSADGEQKDTSDTNSVNDGQYISGEQFESDDDEENERESNRESEEDRECKNESQKSGSFLNEMRMKTMMIQVFI
ncbi:hypothetical protein ACROYT_G015126 [Oculina patagonica]